MLERSQLFYLIALLYIPSLAIGYGNKLLETFPTLADLFKAAPKDLLAMGLPDASIAKISHIDWKQVEKSMRWLEKPGNNVIAFVDHAFPKLLKEIANPPLALFVKGNVSILNSPQIAIVGSRNPSPTGKSLAFDFATELAALGLTITSGLANGIDSMSHAGAIAATGHTIAVMGTGLDEIYPKTNLKLAEEILMRDGAWVSEFPLGVSAIARNFPLRNRIISGMSLGTLVVEAALRSGSLITARLAVEQGREVFAVPGSILNPLVRGCHAIIRQGAKLVENASDIIEELGPIAATLKPQNLLVKADETKNILDRNNKLLLECVGFEPTTMDCLVARSKLSVSEVSAALTALQLQGLVNAGPGGYIKIKN